MAASVGKRLSLVEQKRIQWAKEREELAGLCAPWGLPSKDAADIFRSSIRTHFASAAAAADHLKARRLQQEEQQQLCQQQQQLCQQQEATEGATAGLPPIPGARAGDSQESQSQAECSCREDEGDTSGYGSEANDCALHHRRLPRNAFWDAAASARSGQQLLHGASSAESTSSASALAARGSGGSGGDEAARLRWGDRGVGVGHLWDPGLLQPDHRLPQVVGGDTPGWLERGLRRLGSQPDAQVLVLSHANSGSGSGRTSSSGPSSPSASNYIDRSYIRGQNVPISPEELLERETKRQKALEHQKAIREQLEERERRRKEERERRMREEQMEEARLRRDRELEAQRLREEQRRRKEKELQDARRAQAIREALAEAERRAQRDRGQHQHQHQPRRQEATAHAHTQQQLQHVTAAAPGGGAPATPAHQLRHQETVVATDGVAVVVDGRELLEAVGAAAAAAAPGGGGGLQLALLLPQQVLAERRDAATQTTATGRASDKKSASLERVGRPVRLPSRCRSQSQGRAAPDCRPRWGARQLPHTHSLAHAHTRPAEQRRPTRARPQPPAANHSSDDNSRSPSPPATTTSVARSLKDSAAAATAHAPGRRGLQHVVSLEVRTPRRPADPGGNVSVKLLNRRLQESAPTIVQDPVPEGSENWDLKRPLLTRLSTLRESLLQKQQEWEISRSQTPYSEQSWQS